MICMFVAVATSPSLAEGWDGSCFCPKHIGESALAARATHYRPTKNGRIVTNRLTRVIELYGDRCYWCQEEAQCIDHLTPHTRIPKGEPRNHIENLRPSCHACNNAKGCLTEREYRKVLERLPEGKVRPTRRSEYPREYQQLRGQGINEHVERALAGRP